MSVQLFDNIDINGMFKQKLCIYNVCMVNVCSQMKYSNTDYIVGHSQRKVCSHINGKLHMNIYIVTILKCRLSCVCICLLYNLIEMDMDGCIWTVHACMLALTIEYVSVTLWKCFICVFFGILFQDKIH